MPPDARTLLHDAAPEPTDALDLDVLRRRGRSLARRRIALQAVAVGAVVALAAGLPTLLTRPRVDLVAPPPPATLDATLEADLQAALDLAIATHDLPGAGAAVVFPGGETWAGVAGSQSGGGALSTDTVFPLDYTAELPVAAVVAQLAAEGALALDDPVSSWVPEVDVDGLTLRHLLVHTSGLADIVSSPAAYDAVLAEPSRRWTPSEVLALLPDPVGPPGEELRYPDADYLVLGIAATQAGGTTLGEQLRQRLLEPLGLPPGALVVQAEQAPRGPLAVGTPLPQVAADDPLVPFTAWATAAWPWSGLAARPADAAAVLHAVLSDAVPGGPTLQPMLEFQQLDPPNEPDPPFAAAGLIRHVIGGREVWIADTTGTPGFRGAVAHVPALGVTIFAVGNRGYEPDEPSNTAPDPVRALLNTVLGAFPVEDVALQAAPAADVWVVDVAGGEPQLLLAHPGDDYPLAWSPDGGSLLVQSDRDGDLELYLDAVDGSSSVRLTTALGRDSVGSVSPDGSRVVFQSERDGDLDIWVVGADGSGLVQLTGADPDERGAEWLPAWSPSDGRIVFSRGGPDAGEESVDLWSMAPDGSDARPLASGDPALFLPRFDAAGDRLVTFTADGDLALVDYPSGAVTLVPAAIGPAGPAAWVGDDRLVWGAGEDFGDHDLVIARADGSDARVLVSSSEDEFLPVPAPDGGRVAYARGPAR